MLELQHHVAASLNKSTRSQTALLPALRDAVESGEVKRLLRAALDDEKILSSLQENSYLHENGFLKLTLASTDDFQVRLHVWDTRKGGLATSLESIHSHTADFASILLVGGYRHLVFEPSPHGIPLRAYRYRGVRGERTFAIMNDGIRHLQCTSESLLPAGTAYSLAAKVLHQVIANDDCLTASLVLKGGTVNPDVEVFSEDALHTGAKIPVRALPAEAFRRYAGAVLDRIP